MAKNAKSAKKRATTEAEQKAEAVPKKTAKRDTKPKAAADPKKNAKPKRNTKARTKPKAKAKAEPKANTKAKAKTKPKTNANAKPKTKRSATPPRLSDPDTLTIVWLVHDDTTVRFDELDRTAGWRLDRDERIVEVRTDRPIDRTLLLALAPLLEGDEAMFDVNGVAMLPALLVSGGSVPLPVDPDDIGATMVHGASAAWLPGGPCEFTQRETIWELDGFHWVEASGDMESLVIAVGDLGTPEASLAAAVRASHWFRFDEDGSVVSELEDIPDPDEDHDHTEGHDLESHGIESHGRTDRPHDPSIRWDRPIVPVGQLTMIATFNVTDAAAFADRVARLVPTESGVERRDPHGLDDRFETVDGHVWRADDPAALLVMAFACMPVEGTEFEGWRPRMRAGSVANWPTVYELTLLIDGFVLSDTELRSRWQPTPSFHPWEPPTLMERVALLRSMGAGLLKFEVHSLVTP